MSVVCGRSSDAGLCGAQLFAVPLSFKDWCGGKWVASSMQSRLFQSYDNYCRVFVAVSAANGCGQCDGMPVVSGSTVGGALGAAVVGGPSVVGQGFRRCGVAVVDRVEERDPGYSGGDGASGGSNGTGRGTCNLCGNGCAGSSCVLGVGVHSLGSNGCSGGGGMGLQSEGVRSNRERNRAKRQRRKLRKQRRQVVDGLANVVQSDSVPEWRRTATAAFEDRRPKGGFFSKCDENVKDELRESRAKLLIAQNRRKLIEEERRLKELDSPMRVLQDAMRMVTFAEKCAKTANDSKVAGWAATVSASYAESVARSASPTVQSFDSVSSAQSLERRKQELKFDRTVKNSIELVALKCGILSEQQLYEARIKVLRPLVHADFMRKDAPFKLTTIQRFRLDEAEGLHVVKDDTVEDFFM